LRQVGIERLCALFPTLKLPCFVYDPAVVTANVRELCAAFPAYHYPVKCNAHPALVQAAVAAGATLDLCSDGDIDVAEDVAALTAQSSYTGAGLTPELLGRVAAAGCRINLDSIHEIGLWARLAPGRPCGVRLQIPRSASGYDVKFGLSSTEVDKARAMVGRITGIHVHDSHRGRTPEEAASVLAVALEPLDEIVIGDLEYVSLGGGWPHAYEGEPPWCVSDVAAAIAAKPLTELHRKGFRGEILVEPGEFVVAPAGVWLALVATVKDDRARSGQQIVILDTPTPIPCANFVYPMTLARRRSGSGDYELLGGRTIPCSVYGSTNSGRDCIRQSVLLADPSPGDVMVIREAGAYVQSLISGFNERRAPSTYVLSPP
jgi:diaminopimelate decarboxylase